MTQYTLTEASPRDLVELPDELARALIQLRVATVEPEATGTWCISNVSKVGSFAVGTHQVDILPKTSIAALSFLLGYERSQRFWREEDILSDDNAHPSAAIAFSLSRLIARATSGGILRGYHSEDLVDMTLRGRWDLATQLKRSPGSNLPLHLITDEYDADIAENRILLTALHRLLQEPHVRGPVRTALQALSRRFEGVPLLKRGELPSVVMNRLNDHYSGALHLARIVLRSGSLQQSGAGNSSSGFLLTMSTVFEQFLGEAVAHTATRIGLRTVEQEKSALDFDALVTVKPDITLYRGTSPVAVIDAKYKVEKSDKYPNADIYQAVTYALRLGLNEAHLVYARGETEPRRIDVIGAGVTVYVHALDLELAPPLLIESIDSLVRQTVDSAVTSAPA